MTTDPNKGKKVSQEVLDFFSNSALVTLFVIGILLAIVGKILFDETFLNNLAKIEVARGLITSLISIGTIGIGILIISANYTSQGEDKETANEKFNRGKDILSLFIGVLGTIIGYYFGSSNLPISTTTNPSLSPSTTTPPLISPSPSATMAPLIVPVPSATTAPLISPSSSPKK